MKDSELCKLRLQHEDDAQEHEGLREKQAHLERALREKEKQNLYLKQLIQSGAKSQEAKKAMDTANEEIKRLKVRQSSLEMPGSRVSYRRIFQLNVQNGMRCIASVKS